MGNVDQLLWVVYTGIAAAAVSSWVLLGAVKRIPREGIPVGEIIKPTSMTLGAIWLVGWGVLSFTFAELLWAPILLIPITAPVAVFVVAIVAPPNEKRDRWGEVEYWHDYSNFNIAGGLVIFIALAPQWWAAYAREVNGVGAARELVGPKAMSLEYQFVAVLPVLAASPSVAPRFGQRSTGFHPVPPRP